MICEIVRQMLCAIVRCTRENIYIYIYISLTLSVTANLWAFYIDFNVVLYMNVVIVVIVAIVVVVACFSNVSLSHAHRLSKATNVTQIKYSSYFNFVPFSTFSAAIFLLCRFFTFDLSFNWPWFAINTYSHWPFEYVIRFMPHNHTRQWCEFLKPLLNHHIISLCVLEFIQFFFCFCLFCHQFLYTNVIIYQIHIDILYHFHHDNWFFDTTEK